MILLEQYTENRYIATKNIQKTILKDIPIKNLYNISRYIFLTGSNEMYVVLKNNIQTKEVLVDDILDYLADPKNTIEDTAKYFWMTKKKIKRICSRFGIIKDNNNAKYCDN